MSSSSDSSEETSDEKAGVAEKNHQDASLFDTIESMLYGAKKMRL